MALAPVAYSLWQQFLRFDPQDPVWPNRDRFVLSIGHASILLYSLLHLTEVRAVSKDYETLGEVSVPLDAIKAFRQLDSRCPDIRSAAGPLAWKLVQGRSVKAYPPPSAWRSVGSGWPRATTAPVSRISSISASTRYAETDA